MRLKSQVPDIRDHSTPAHKEVNADNTIATLERYAQNGASLKLHVDGGGGECIVLPPDAVKHLLSILKAYAQGHDVSVTRLYAELTTGEAAKLLRVSRPYMVKLLESGELPFHKVGRNRRVLREDVMKYKLKRRKKRKAILAELTAEGQALGLYD